jgi:sulfoxide reductase heme-binding subunit YedZ
MVSILPLASTAKGAGQKTRRTLRNDLRAAMVDAAAALVLSVILFAILMARVRAGIDPAAVEMPAMLGNGGIGPYTLSQAVGWAALLWSWLTILLGVSLPIWAWQGAPRAREAVERLHRSTSLTVVGLIVAHAVLLLWDGMGDTLVTIFVPWTTSYVPGLFPEALGIFSFYLAVLLGLSFYLRDRIGLRTWRVLHRYVIPAVYVLAVWHTFLYGSDLRVHNGLWIALWLMQIPIIAGFVFRVAISRPRMRQAPLA